MASPQTLSEPDRRSVAAWAVDCAERILGLLEAEARDDDDEELRWQLQAGLIQTDPD